MGKKGGNISKGRGGRKKVYNKGAMAALQTAKRAHKKLLDTSLKKNERDPVTRELNAVKAYLEKLAYTPSEEINKGKVPKAKSDENKEILHEHEEAVKEALVKGFSTKLIQEELYDLSGKIVHINTLNGFRKRFRESDEFKTRNEEYLKSVDTMRLYTKVGRIEELTELYRDSYERYQHSPSRENQNQCIKILDQARKESDSPAVYNFKMEQNNLQVNGQVTFNLLGKEEEKELFKRMPINEIIIGRIAARSDSDPTLMMKRLQQSYYAKQAGMFGLASTDDDIKYPSELHYDIEDMVDKHRKIQAEEAQILEESKDDVTDEDPSDLKKKLLKKVRKKKGGKDESKD